MLLLHAEMWVDYNLKNLSIILVNISIGKGIDIVAFRQPTVRKDAPGFWQAGLEHVGELSSQPVEGVEALGGKGKEHGATHAPFALEEGVALQPEVLEEADQGLEKLFGLFSQVFDDQSIPFSIVQQGQGKGDLPAEVLGEENGVGLSIDAPELAVEDPSIVFDPLDDGGGFEIVVVCSFRQLGESLFEGRRSLLSRWAGHR
jgi:hypothetical protein